jgi:hypothetical protein
MKIWNYIKKYFKINNCKKEKPINSVNNEKKEQVTISVTYKSKQKPYMERPKFDELSKEEIDAIHARGNITQKEKVKEWEGFDLCAPGDAAGSASWRCEKFGNCHDCLVDYSKMRKEYEPLSKIIQEVGSLIYNEESEEKGKVLTKRTIN